MKLLLLPGMDGTGRLFEPFLDALPPGFDPVVVAYDPQQPMGYRELLATVRSACPRAEPFLLLGESFSGPLAIMVAAEAPANLRGVALCASFVRCPLRLPRWLVAAAAQPMFFRWGPRWPARRALLGSSPSQQLVRLFDDAADAVAPAVMAARVRAIAAIDVADELRRVQAPMLYLQARHDWLVGRHCREEIQRLRPDLKVAEFAAPHLLLQTCPHEAAAALAEFASWCSP